MAGNSASCKTWCVTIVSAIIVVIADKNRPSLVWIAIFPTIIFGLLDTYYLGLEKGFRAAYEGFVRKLHSGTLTPDDLYNVKPAPNSDKHEVAAFKSITIWGFYLSLIALAALVYFVATVWSEPPRR